MKFLIRRLFFAKKAQALVELTLIFPMMLVLTLGAVEMGNLIYTYQVIHHLTAQGANIAARLGSRTTVEAMMDSVVDGACPLLSRAPGGPASCPAANTSKWRVLYTEIGPDPSDVYVVKEQRVLGTGTVDPSKLICKDCGSGSYTCDPVSGGCAKPSLPNLDKIGSGQSLYAFEVFYDYTPMTTLGNFVGESFAGKLYERSIF